MSRYRKKKTFFRSKIQIKHRLFIFSESLSTRFHFLQPVKHINNTHTHAQLLDPIPLPTLRIPHLPQPLLNRPIDPLPPYLLKQLRLVILPQPLQNEIVRCRPSWTTPHQIYSENRVVSRIRTRNSWNRVVRFVVLFLNSRSSTSLNIARMLSLWA